jgi:hypothetical protein
VGYYQDNSIEDLCDRRFEGFENDSYWPCVQGQQNKIDQDDSRNHVTFKVANDQWQERKLS